MYRGQDELISFKMMAGDVISIRGQVLEYMYIPTGIERELVDLVRMATRRISCRDLWRRIGAHSI